MDGCNGEVLIFQATAGTTPGVRQVGGPTPGSDLDVGHLHCDIRSNGL